jgi:hypothetical protein
MPGEYDRNKSYYKTISNHLITPIGAVLTILRKIPAFSSISTTSFNVLGYREFFRQLIDILGFHGDPFGVGLLNNIAAPDAFVNGEQCCPPGV